MIKRTRQLEIPKMERPMVDDTQPKGVTMNLWLVRSPTDALAKLMIAKGVITERANYISTCLKG
jgi:hypothetical protein